MMHRMTRWSRRLIVFVALLAVAGAGVVLGQSAPQGTTDDELVYLTGALQMQDGDLPDARMLEGYDYGPYLQPKIMLAWYEAVGSETFKSLLLAFLVLATGLAGYALFRTLGLAWVPSLLLSIVALMPRVAAGTEFWGVLSFREAIGRSVAVPFFLAAAALLLYRVTHGKSAWPVFFLIGLLLFFHPVTTTLFAFVLLFGLGAVRLVQKAGIVRTLSSMFASGVAFLIGGAYFFVDVAGHLAGSASSAGASSAAYVAAILFRNAWEFAPETLLVYRHMLLVSLIFLVLLAAVYLLPQMRVVRRRFRLASERPLLAFGITLMLASQALALLIPSVNLWLMQHADASYMFQQWSRISKFYYLGLFVALVPALHVLWGWYRESRVPLKHVAVGLLFFVGVVSSTPTIEVGQFLAGSAGYTSAYIPQALSGKPDGIRIGEYRETCAALEMLGVTRNTELVSHDFGLRYFCKANLYVTQEEGAAYTYLSRADLIWWHETYLRQRDALREGDIAKMHAFAIAAGAQFIVLSREERYRHLEETPGAVVTSRHIILPAAR